MQSVVRLPSGTTMTATNSPTEKQFAPQAGTWTLTAPDGRTWTADNPLAVVGREQRERVPASVALQRIAKEMDTWCEGAIAVRLIGSGYVVEVERAGRWIEVIRSSSPSHIVEVTGINECLKKAGML